MAGGGGLIQVSDAWRHSECDPDLASDVAAIVDDSAPESACLVPACIARVGAKHEQERESWHGNGERLRRDGGTGMIRPR